MGRKPVKTSAKKVKAAIKPQASKAKAAPQIIYATRAERNIAWCEKYIRIPEGKFVGQPLTMAEFMKEDLRAIYDNKYGTRRAILSRGRKNAKTTECAMILLLHLVGPEVRPNSQLFSSAQSRDQAALIFSLAVKMIRQNGALFNYITIKESTKTLVCEALGITYRALAAEATTAFGLSPALIMHDELGQVRGPRSTLYEALETATAAQENPLSIVISTQAPNDNDLLSILIDDAAGGHDPKTVLRLNTAGKEFEDPFTEAAMRAANPGFDIFMNRTEVIAMAENARRMPARQAEYENLVLNRRVEASNPFVSATTWRLCGSIPKDIHGMEVYGGLDLSSVQDLTALVLMGRVDKVWQVRPWFWLPSEGLREKAQRDHVPYDLWADQGHLETTPGASISYEYVAQRLFDLFKEYSIRKLGFDRWGMKYFTPWLKQAGFTDAVIAEKFVELGQGTLTMTPALRDMEQAILDRQIAHGNHPVMAMCAACAVVEGNDSARKLSKQRSNGRIDGLVALADAFSVAPMQSNVFDISSLIG
jgi:phage terminase large subunit-like protein